jgi:hypothetical protein
MPGNLPEARTEARPLSVLSAEEQTLGYVSYRYFSAEEQTFVYVRFQYFSAKERTLS